jgi:hypothetical protein
MWQLEAETGRCGCVGGIVRIMNLEGVDDRVAHLYGLTLKRSRLLEDSEYAVQIMLTRKELN